MSIELVWKNVSRRAPPSRRVLIEGLRAFLATADNPHATLLSGREGHAAPDKDSAHAMETMVIEQYGRQLHSRLDVADWLRLLYDAENELIQRGVELATTRLAKFPTPQSSPFNTAAMYASRRVTRWRHALGQWIQSDPSGKTRDEWRAAIAISTILHGALLDITKINGLTAMLDGDLEFKEAAGYAFVEFDMPFQGMGNHHLQRWFLDPCTELLILRLPTHDATPTSKSLSSGIKKFFQSNGGEPGKCPTGLGDLVSSASTWWSCHAAQIDLHAIRRTFCTHSIHPRTAQRLFDYQAEHHRLRHEVANNSASGEYCIVEDAHVLHPWLAESINLLNVSSIAVAQESIELLFAEQPDEAIAKVYVGWLRDLLTGNSASKSPLALSTIRKRYVTTTERLLALLGVNDPRVMKTVELEDFYAELVLEENPDRPLGALAKGLADFHAHLVSAHNKQHIAKPNQVFGDDASLIPVDANLVSFDDYLSAQSWLDVRLIDGADPDDATICKLVMAMAFRLGMRRMEILGLRLRDVQVRWGMVCLVRPHPERRLKTTNSRRLIPIDAFFDWRERRLLKEWCTRRRAEVAKLPLPPESQRSQYLFSRVDENGVEKQASVDGVVGRIYDALRATTGDSRIFLHHLRHAFGTWTYLRLRAPDYPMAVDFFTHLPETAQAIRHGNRLRLQLIGTRGNPSRIYAHAVARLLGHSSPQVSMGHYIHASDLILAAITHRETDDIPLPELVVSSGLPSATAYRHLEASAHQLVLAARKRYRQEKTTPQAGNTSKNLEWQRAAESPTIDHPAWLSLQKVWAVLHLSRRGHSSLGIANMLGLNINQIETIQSKARTLAPLIGLKMSIDSAIPCPVKPRLGRGKEFARELESRLFTMAIDSPKTYLKGLELLLSHINRQKWDVVFRGRKDAANLRRSIVFLKRIGFGFDRLQWVVRRMPEDAVPLPEWVGQVDVPWVPARVKRIAPPSTSKASSYAQWVGLLVLDDDGNGPGHVLAVTLFLALVGANDDRS